MIDKQLITGLIIAGGRGTRMGQVDKGLQNFNHIPMTLHVLKRLSPQVGKIIINANQNISEYKKFGAPVYSDRMKDFAGPLAGIQAGLSECTTPYLLTAPCDSPMLPMNLAQALSDALISNNADIAVATSVETEENITKEQRHPVFSLIKLSCLESLNNFLSVGGRKVDHWLQQQLTINVMFKDSASFVNVNTMQELQLLERKQSQ